MLTRSLSKFGSSNLLNSTTTRSSSSSSGSNTSGQPINASDVLGLAGAINDTIQTQDFVTTADVLEETKTNNIKFTENEMNFKNNNDEKMLTITNENVNVLKPLFLNGEQFDPNNLITKDELKSEVKTGNIKLDDIKTSKFVKNVNGFIGTSDDETISFTASFNVPIKITKIIFPTSFWHSNSTRTLVVSTMSENTTYNIQKINQHLDEHEIEVMIELDDNKLYTFQLDVKSDDGFYQHGSNGDIVIGGLNNYVIFDDVVGSVLGTKIPFDFEFEYISDKIINVDYLNTLALKSDLPNQSLDIDSSVDFNSVTINGGLVLDDTFEVPNQSLQTNSDVKFNNVETSGINVGGFQTSTFDDENLIGDVIYKYKHLKINDQLIETIRFDISTQDYLKSFKGNLQPSLDNQYDFGSESTRWQGVYANTVNTSNLLIDNVPFSDHSQSLVDMNSTIGIIEQTVQNIQAEVPSAVEMQSINTTLTSIANTFTSLGITQLGHLNNAIQNTQTFPTASTFFHGNGESVARMVFMGGPSSPDDGRTTSEIVFANDITPSIGWDINTRWNYAISSQNYDSQQELHFTEVVNGVSKKLLKFKPINATQFNEIAEFGVEVQAPSFRTLGSNKTLEERISTIESVLGIA